MENEPAYITNAGGESGTAIPSGSRTARAVEKAHRAVKGAAADIAQSLADEMMTDPKASTADVVRVSNYALDLDVAAEQSPRR